jgi:hypothetical protein
VALFGFVKTDISEESVTLSSGQKISRVKISLLAARLIVYPEDRDETFLLGVGSYTDYTALYPRRWKLP